ncbi:MAG: metallophosphoesterase, partial [Dactylosporangium sp.]|nr:metallophosphoesterase [Dactylosporangium sp.]
MLGVFLLIIVTVVGLIHWYLWRRLVCDTTDRGPWRRVGTALTIVLAILPVAAVAGRGLPLEQQRWVAWPGYLWLSVMFLALSTLLVLEIPRLALRRWVRRPPAVDAKPAPALVGAADGGDPAAPDGGAVGV